jgi:hypothetical protein
VINRRGIADSVVWAVLLLLVCAQEVDAYIDPGIGSYIYQLAIAGLLGAAVAVKIYWKRIRASISHLLSGGQSEADDSK